MNDRKAVTLQAGALVKAVRDFSRSQVDQWRRIPWLAVEADGRSGYDGRLHSAYAKGVWLVYSDPDRLHRVSAYVDLLSGDLLNTEAFLRRGKIEQLSDSDVVQFSLTLQLRQLDASVVVRRLQAEADRPHSLHFKAEEQENQRKKLRAQFNIKPIYDADAVRHIG